MKIAETYEYILPVYSAGYFVNGNLDGYEDIDIEKFKNFEKRLERKKK